MENNCCRLAETEKIDKISDCFDKVENVEKHRVASEGIK